MQTQAQTHAHKIIAQTPIIHTFQTSTKLELSGSPFLQKTSVKKNQNRFHQSKPDTDLDPNNNPIKEYNHITTCLYTHSKAQQPK